MSDQIPPYAVELVNYGLNDDADPDAFLAINRDTLTRSIFDAL